MKFYVTDDADGRTQLERYTRAWSVSTPPEPWWTTTGRSSWQKYYKPLSIGERLYVVPQWEREEPVPRDGSPSI